MSLTQQNTEQLIAMCRKQDQNAQLEIYNRYYKAMFNTALRIIKDAAEAEDIMQEAFLTAFTKLQMLEDDRMFGAWLKRIVINSSLTASRKNDAHREVSLETVEYALTDTDGVAEEDLTKVKVNTVLNKLNELKDSYSTALSLHLIEGYDYEEICQIMNISYSNCRTLVSRAKESLRKKLQYA
ncbi:RNA polymerase sigma factor [Aquimarina sp. 2201CG5-10]|uniref:RNA polymerase sigma factor n=1 Tax=Aquimarina callyspongiae TaxID=3098150 RepID=UPI002AB3D885|nr:RNA polymerase sigma factor [Aquimarina sp. 2201CG5-10]MDY8136266.1 RNA polymerase sigma factor [Aquimarina sp. 2201CG5-10]